MNILNPRLHQKICKNCHRIYYTKRSDSKNCSNACRARYNNLKQFSNGYEPLEELTADRTENLQTTVNEYRKILHDLEQLNLLEPPFLKRYRKIENIYLTQIQQL